MAGVVTEAWGFHPGLKGEVMTRRFALRDRVTKISGSSWTGKVVGFYSTTLTPDGVCVESEHEPGSVQIYPAHALKLVEQGW